MVFLIALIALFAPRLALFLVWVLTPLVSRAFGTFIVPLLGFLFLPFTTLAYSLVYIPSTGTPTGLGWLLVVVAFILDISAYGGTAYRSRGQSRGYEDQRAA